MDRRFDRHLAEHDGVATTAQLRGLGATRHDLRRWAETGTLIRLRPGWYARPDVEQDVRCAVAAGGAMSGSAALARHGLWIPAGEPFQVRARERARVARLTIPAPPGGEPAAIEPYALPRSRDLPVVRAVDEAPTALLAAMLSRPRDTAVILADSALHTRRITWGLLRRVAERAGYKGGEVLSRVAGTAESGTETCFRLWLVAHGIRFRAQARICRGCRVDFLIGDRLIVEIDSRMHHTDPSAYAKDRARDRMLLRMGYRVLRLTYAEAMHGLDEVGRDVLALIRRREHLGPLAA
ncbi:type IV toxin-antitoxin system AbiEi family antitoxin domain-containing protein [Gulosibacter sp. 10]|uniref:type IV toxin-antitoxin system AbiEi family antitoxin domain-containing protein n=1 Tax=Gulosibacter sp. 10 TaxID=1255570 RepID=UPI00097EDCAB|nr:type IV toxin-antitoxin system AbiEi family antitoxin domain-containing protein [Gulosibacter sp. 10]SJM71018.1 hypothetical protein FM112_15800 [Gulosibacter sp. 10]